MSVLYAEGFTSIPRAASTGSASNLPLLGYTLGAYNNNTSNLISNASIQFEIIPDPIFGDRSRLQIWTLDNRFNWMVQAKKNLDTRGFNKYVIGFVANASTPLTTNFMEVILTAGGGWSNVSSLPTDLIARIRLNNDGTPGTAFGPNDTTGSPIAALKGQDMHIEALIEEDVDRVRVYVDGSLALDYTYTGNFGAQAGGFMMVGRWPTGNAVSGSKTSFTFSDIYMLGLDAIHTGVLGPAARVLEIVPPGDLDVHWARPDGYNTNAEVLAQLLTVTNPDMLAARKVGDYDIYQAPNAVAANAVQIFGAGFKINAMTMAAGNHSLVPVVKTGTGVHEIGPEAPLTLGTMTQIFVDASKNPDTNAIWTPSQLSQYGFGMKLKS